MIRITYAPDLVEQVVLLAERALPASEARAFRRERDRLYRIDDPDRREAAFRAVHQRWFAHLQLNRIVDHVTRSRMDSAGRVTDCHVLPAIGRRDEGADLVDEAGAADVPRGPILILRLRSATFMDPQALYTLLHHELTHVTDILDPAFGYERMLPPSDDGPSADTILRDRYRVVWDTTIDGRLTRAGLASGVAREARWQEFAAAFAMPASSSRYAFEEWFAEAHPTHARLVAFATRPFGLDERPVAGRCPLCRFLVPSLDSRAQTMTPAALAIVQTNHPQWRGEHGMCAQCFDLYEARHEEACGASRR